MDNQIIVTVSINNSYFWDQESVIQSEVCKSFFWKTESSKLWNGNQFFVVVAAVVVVIVVPQKVLQRLEKERKRETEGERERGREEINEFFVWLNRDGGVGSILVSP